MAFMIKDVLLDMLEESDLPSGFKIVAEFCGLDIAKHLLRELEGMQIYIPQIKTLTPLHSRYIKKNINKKSIRYLASDIGLTEKAVRNIAKKL